MRSTRHRVTVAMLIVAALAITATAQGQWQSRGQQQWGQQQSRSQQWRGQQQQQQQTSRRGNIVADPQGWVLIGYDYDQDQQVDAYEYIHIYDLQRARQMSQQRPQGRQRAQVRQAPGARGQRSQAQEPRTQQRGQQQWFQAGQQRSMAAARQRMQQLTGTIQQTKQIKLAGQQQQHTFAKVQTQQGRTVVVDLGPSNKVNQLNLSQGDRIQAQGDVTMVNDRPVLMANRVQSGNQSISVQRPKGSQTRRLEGTITKTATKRLEGQNQPAHLVALVELESGQNVPVDLGRKQDLQDVSIQQGKSVVLLARPARIGNRTILIAEKMSVDGEQIDVQWLQKAMQQQRGQRQARN